MATIVNVWNNVWPYLIAVLMFVLLIIIHELGHFIAAKSVGVKVNEFAVGFGPKLFSKQGKETKYSINLLPFGGFCAMEGEDNNSTDPRGFCNQKPLKRFIIVVMGATFNLIFGLIIVAIMLTNTKMFTSVQIADFPENSVSGSSGLQKEDVFYSVEGRRVFSSVDLSYAFTNVKGNTLDITALRDGQKVELDDVRFDVEEIDGMNYISIDFYVYGEQKTFGKYLEYTGKTALSYARIVWFSFIDLISGKFGLSQISGPVGITATIGNVAKENLFNILPIMAIITINLGIFNLFPIPALDGGRILFILIEMITRKAVPQKYESAIHAVGFAILLAFMVFIAGKDIVQLIMG